MKDRISYAKPQMEPTTTGRFNQISMTVNLPLPGKEIYIPKAVRNGMALSAPPGITVPTGLLLEFRQMAILFTLQEMQNTIPFCPKTSMHLI